MEKETNYQEDLQATASFMNFMNNINPIVKDKIRTLMLKHNPELEDHPPVYDDGETTFRNICKKHDVIDTIVECYEMESSPDYMRFYTGTIMQITGYQPVKVITDRFAFYFDCLDCNLVMKLSRDKDEESIIIDGYTCKKEEQESVQRTNPKYALSEPPKYKS